MSLESILTQIDDVLYTWLLIYLLAGSGIYFTALDDYESQMARGLDPVFHESNIGLTNTDVWKDSPEDDTPADVGGDTGIRM